MDAIFMSWGAILVAMAGAMGALLIWTRRRAMVAARKASIRLHSRTTSLSSAALSAEQRHTFNLPNRRRTLRK